LTLEEGTPKRIQRQRRKGWKKPANAMIVDRTSRWGNPYKVPRKSPPAVILKAVADFARYAEGKLRENPRWVDPLRGHDLACWCPEDVIACHADVLLRLANGD
jgi:hypothetical protein